MMREGLTLLMLGALALTLTTCQVRAECVEGEIACPLDPGGATLTPSCRGYEPFWETEAERSFPSGGNPSPQTTQLLTFERDEIWPSCEIASGPPICPFGDIAVCLAYRQLTELEMRDAESYCQELSAAPESRRDGYKVILRCRWQAPLDGFYEDGTPIDDLNLGHDLRGVDVNYEPLPAAAQE